MITEVKTLTFKCYGFFSFSIKLKDNIMNFKEHISIILSAYLSQVQPRCGVGVVMGTVLQ